MDPQTQAFTPYSTNSDTWRMQSEVSKIQQVQTEHAERLARLERRQEEDARVKSVWGSSSPFPSVLSGTPQQAPLQHPPFDDVLHLDVDEEPRRAMGGNSRANSVRFDESANQNHFSHLSRPSFDYLSRTTLGGLSLGERSGSHKSDGRASSAHSIRSAASGRASLNLDTTYVGEPETPSLAPGLALLGSAPAIIRCWLNTNFKHDSQLYAAVCTGSFKSYLGFTLIQKLGFEELISDDHGLRTIQLPVYFPEAVPHSRSSSPQLPCLTVSFQVVDAALESKAIQIVLGSDTLRSHNADILFSSSSLTLFDDDRSKLSIPLVRPENAATFNTLRTLDAVVPEASIEKYRPPIGQNGDATDVSHASDARPASRGSVASRPSLSINARTESNDTDHTAGGSHRSPSGSAVWSSWRKETTPTLDWAAAKNRDSSYQRKDTGIKVLKPKSTRAVSSATPTTPSIEGRSSRFFDEGRRRSGTEGDAKSEERRENVQPSAPAPAQPGTTQAQPKVRSNPVGGGTAFSWLNSSSK